MVDISKCAVYNSDIISIIKSINSLILKKTSYGYIYHIYHIGMLVITGFKKGTPIPRHARLKKDPGPGWVVNAQPVFLGVDLATMVTMVAFSDPTN